jgi:hypothetical protein
LWTWSWLRPREGGAHCAEPPPQRPARCASQSARPLRWMIVSRDHHPGRWSRPEGPGGSGVNGLTPGPLRLLGRLSPAGPGPAVVTRASLSLAWETCGPTVPKGHAGVIAHIHKVFSSPSSLENFTYLVARAPCANVSMFRKVWRVGSASPGRAPCA